VQEIIQLGTWQMKVRRAAEMHQARAWRQGHVAERASLSQRDLIRETRAPGTEPPLREQTVHEELGA
jgi:hypothetical protein